MQFNEMQDGTLGKYQDIVSKQAVNFFSSSDPASFEEKSLPDLICKF